MSIYHVAATSPIASCPPCTLPKFLTPGSSWMTLEERSKLLWKQRSQLSMLCFLVICRKKTAGFRCHQVSQGTATSHHPGAVETSTFLKQTRSPTSISKHVSKLLSKLFNEVSLFPACKFAKIKHILIYFYRAELKTLTQPHCTVVFLWIFEQTSYPSPRAYRKAEGSVRREDRFSFPAIHVYVFFRFSSLLGYYKILSIVPCAIQCVLVVHLFYI